MEREWLFFIETWSRADEMKSIQKKVRKVRRRWHLQYTILPLLDHELDAISWKAPCSPPDLLIHLAIPDNSELGNLGRRPIG